MSASNVSAPPDDVQRVVDRIAAILPDQPPLSWFAHFNALEGELDLGFEEAVRLARLRRRVRGYPAESTFRAAWAAGRITAHDLDTVLAERFGARLDQVVATFGEQAIPRGRIWRQAMLRDLAALPPAQLPHRLRTRGLTVPASDMSREAAAALLRGRDPHEVLSGLWRAVVTALGLQDADPIDPTPAPSPPPHTATQRAAWAAEAASLAERNLGSHLAVVELWSEALGADLTARLDALLTERGIAFLDDGVAPWTPTDREVGFWRWFRQDLTRSSGLPGTPAQARALEGLSEQPTTAIVELLELLGAPPSRWQGLLEIEAMRNVGWSAMAAFLGARPLAVEHAARPFDLAGWLAARLAATWLVVGEAAEVLGIPPRVGALTRWAGEHHDEAVVRRLLGQGTLPDDLARHAHSLAASRRAPADAWSALAHAIWARGTVPELEALRALASKAWPAFGLCQHLALDGEDVGRAPPEALRALTSALLEFDEGARAPVWLAAYEAHYRDQVLAGLAANHPHPAPREREQRPSAQLALCIDDREESLRRHLEEVDPTVETFGIAGFFGVAMRYQGLDDLKAVPLCPGNQDPPFLVREILRDGQTPPPRTLWTRLADRIGVRTPHGALTRLDFLAAGSDADRTPLRPQAGFTDAEQADRLQAALRGMGLLRFAPLVVIMGHGGTSLNNPYAPSYDCGACGGKHGGPNARLFAAMANRSEIRRILAERGIDIPADTWFVGAEHDTTSDRITWFDHIDVPASHREALETLRVSLDESCARDALERCRRLAFAPVDATPAEALAHAIQRSTDPAQARPELGHTCVASAFVGRRDLTRGLFLDRRAFLVSYDPTTDPDGMVLDALLMAAGPVGSQISLDYYFSAADPQAMGAGSKAGQNVAGLVGALQGTAGDLHTGLPWQMTELHEPMRLLLVVEAPLARLGEIHGRRPVIRHLIDGAWLHLVAVDPEDGTMHRFLPGAGFTPWAPPPIPVPRRATSAAWFLGHRDTLGPALVGEVHGV